LHDFANENRFAAGTYFPITLKKHMRAQAIAEQCGLPCIYIADSGGSICQCNWVVLLMTAISGQCFIICAECHQGVLNNIHFLRGEIQPEAPTWLSCHRIDYD